MPKKKILFWAYVAYIGISLAAIACVPTGKSQTSKGPLEKPVDSSTDAGSMRKAKNHRKFVCDNPDGCTWDVTCPDTGTFTMEAERGGDIEIGPRCGIKSH